MEDGKKIYFELGCQGENVLEALKQATKESSLDMIVTQSKYFGCIINKVYITKPNPGLKDRLWPLARANVWSKKDHQSLRIRKSRNFENERYEKLLELTQKYAKPFWKNKDEMLGVYSQIFFGDPVPYVDDP